MSITVTFGQNTDDDSVRTVFGGLIGMVVRVTPVPFGAGEPFDGILDSIATDEYGSVLFLFAPWDENGEIEGAELIPLREDQIEDLLYY